ncbi:hypothetical protein [Microbacterium testaceum]|uniref:hypothetical protein n=1 Tax=Microbacterium testaceum TaxID=2033 RepID=UPI001142338C|nr:hypothetical protein [Microbacterium testaceum]
MSNLSPDAHVLGPLVKAHAKATADLLEYYLDAEGGVDGVIATRNFLILAASTLLECEFDEHDDHDTPEEVKLVEANIQAPAIPVEAGFGETEMRHATQRVKATEPPLITDVPDFPRPAPAPGSRRARRTA